MRANAIFSLLAGVALVWFSSSSLSGAGPAPAGENSLKPLAADAWDYAKARHLLFRAGFGGPPEEVAKLQALGLHKAVDHLLNLSALPLADFPFSGKWPDVIKPGEFAKLTPQEREKKFMERARQDFMAIAQVRDWWNKRMVESPRQLEEKMVLFWHGHFTSEHRTVRSAQAMFLQNQLFREHAVGNYGKLLNGIIHNAAMLRYLDNNTNVKGKPNENLARELLELFSMGEGQGYTEKDIKEAARALTGYSFDRESLQFRFRSFMHDNGPKTIFGQTGKWNGDDLIKLILQQPSPPRFMARKLFVFFVHQEPSAQTVEALARLFKESNFELTPLLRTMFLSEEFYSSRAMGTQIKSPAQLVVGTLRTLKVRPPAPAPGKFGPGGGGMMNNALRSMGQELFNPPNVKGWDGGQAWINTHTLFLRENFAAGVVTGRGNMPPPFKQGGGKQGGGKPFFRPPSGVALDLVSVMQEKKLHTPEVVVNYWAQALLAIPLTEDRRQELLTFLGTLPAPAEWANRRSEINTKLGGLLVLLMSLPEYQLT